MPAEHGWRRLSCFAALCCSVLHCANPNRLLESLRSFPSFCKTAGIMVLQDLAAAAAASTTQRFDKCPAAACRCPTVTLVAVSTLSESLY